MKKNNIVREPSAYTKEPSASAKEPSARMNSQLLRKLILLCLLALITMFAVACGSGNDDDKKKNSSNHGTSCAGFTSFGQCIANLPSSEFGVIIHNGINEAIDYCAINVDNGQVVTSLFLDNIYISTGNNELSYMKMSQFEPMVINDNLKFDVDCVGISGTHYYSNVLEAKLTQGSHIDINLNQYTNQNPKHQNGQICTTYDDKLGKNVQSTWVFNQCQAFDNALVVILKNSLTDGIVGCQISVGGDKYPAFKISSSGIGAYATPLKHGHTYVVPFTFDSSSSFHVGSTVDVTGVCAGVSGKTYNLPTTSVTIKSSGAVGLTVQ